nr:immunoglobulin light chain junction region [Macaca mulatta]
CFQYFSGYSF